MFIKPITFSIFSPPVQSINQQTVNNEINYVILSSEHEAKNLIFDKHKQNNVQSSLMKVLRSI